LNSVLLLLLYASRAGTRNSPLTTHGALQASRLGSHLNALATPLNHVFASPLTRAALTAQAISDARNPSIPVVLVPEIQEQDFGIFEGVHYREWSSMKEAGQEQQDTIEKDESMDARAQSFINEYLIPITAAADQGESIGVAIVSHGIMLRHIWREILLWTKPIHVECPQDLLVGTGSLDYARLGSWSNTGVLEVAFERITSKTTLETCWKARIFNVNGTHHLNSLKRTKGGIGSAQFDNRQKTLDKFFLPK
jgi:broad specificity phosphatase PhoE